MHERGLRITLNLHPADGVRAHEEAYPAMARALGREPDGEPIDFDVTDREFLTAYIDLLHRDLERDGVDFWWIDWQQGRHSRAEGVDPLWILNHYHFLDSAAHRRGLILSRYAGPGSHRYPVGFSGDTVISWDSLEFQAHFTATAANIGYGWWSHDIGGHAHGTKDDELTVRWVQFGVFSPVMRLHSGRNPFLTKEPWSFPGSVRDIVGELMQLRHRLIPYLHTMNHRAAEGEPLVLPLYYDHPEAPEAYERTTQYRFGSELVVAPITRPADAATGYGRVRAWLPEGTWVDVLADIVYEGGRENELHRDLSAIPVLAPAGGIVPLDAAAVPGNDPVNPAGIELLLVAGADGEFTLIEDDDGRDGALARTRIEFRQATGHLTVHPPKEGREALPGRRDWTLTLPATDPHLPIEAWIGTDPVTVTRDDTATRVRATVTGVPVGATLTFDLGPRPRLRRNDTAELAFRRIDDARIDHGVKARLYRALTADRPVAALLSALFAWQLPPALTSAIAEIFIASDEVGTGSQPDTGRA